MNHISIVIPTFNSAKTLLDCLGGIRKLSNEYSVNAEVIIIDAGSTDETIAISQEYTQKIIVSKGVSRGKARNIGAENASADTLVFLDSDCIITPEWVKHLLSLQVDTCSTIIAGPAVLVEANTTIGSAVKEKLSSRLFTLSSYTFSLDADQKEVKDVPSSNILVSKKFFNQIGGFPDLNFNEDGVFCTRVLASNGKIIYFPSFKVLHKKTFDKVSKFAHYFFQYGRSYAKNLKHYPELINRYGILAVICAFSLMIGTVLVSFLDTQVLTYFAIALLIYFILTLSYSMLKFKNLNSGIIPLLFLILVLSYLGGFYYGFLESIHKHDVQ